MGLGRQFTQQRLIARLRASARVCVVLAMGALLAGCVTDGATPFSSSAARGTIAFESIDGLPQAQFQKLVSSLTEEAATRQISVVPREGAAQYRARGYAAAHLRGKRTIIAWVWDVYNADQQRVLRISGEEQPSGNQRGWSAADDTAMRRIASESMTQIAGFLKNPGGYSPPAPPDREEPGVAVASADRDADPSLRRSFAALGQR